MSNRIDGPRVARPAQDGIMPVSEAETKAAAEVGKFAGNGLDVAAARKALGSVGAAALPNAPALDIGAAASDVRAFGQGLLDFFGDVVDAVPGVLDKIFVKPLQNLAWGAGQKLVIDAKQAFPTAKAESWRGKTGADIPWRCDPVEDRAVAALLKEELAGGKPSPNDHGLTPARLDALRSGYADSPRVQAALDSLAADGKLTQVAAGGGTLLAHLEKIANAPLDKTVEAERSDLLGEVIIEVQQSGSVAQRGMNTCGASSAAAHLCYSDPAEYARLVAGLASPAGTVKTANGVELKRDEKWDLDCDTQSKTGIQRTLSGRLLQPAIMDLGAINEYDNETDLDRIWVARMGTKPAGVERQMEALTGKNWDWTSTTTGIGRNQVADRLKGASLDHPVIVAMNYNDEGEVSPSFHWIRVVGYDEASKQIIIRNTQRGTEERIDYGEFRERMFYAVHERTD